MALTSNIAKVGAIAVPQVTRGLMSDLQLLDRHNFKKFVKKYPKTDYFTMIETFSDKVLTTGKDFYHHEDLGKLMLSFAVQTAVTAPAAGASVTIVLTADSHITINGTNYSGIRVGENVRLASNDREGQILSVNKGTNNAHSCVVRPLDSSVAFVSAGSANLLAGEVVKLVGMVDRGEASGSVDTQTPVEEKITGKVSTFHDTYTATDHAEMEEVEYTIDAGDIPTNTAGIVSAYTLRGMDDWNQRFMNNRAGKLMFGQLITNTGLPTGADGTLGLIPAVTLRGGTTTYTVGSMDVAKIREVTRFNRVNGGPRQIQWLQDMFQAAEFDDTLFSKYGAGAFNWGTGSASEEASVAYGFQRLFIDNTMVQLTDYPFNTEEVYGRAPTTDAYRNFGLIVPQGQMYDRKAGRNIPNLSIMYQEPTPIRSGEGSVENGLRVWRHGGGSPAATNGTLFDSVEMACYWGLRTAAINQFQIVVGS